MNTQTKTLPYTPVDLSSQEVSSSSCIIFKIEGRLLESYYTRKIMEKVEKQSKIYNDNNKDELKEFIYKNAV